MDLNKKRKNLFFFILSVIAALQISANHLNADLLMDLESGNFNTLESIREESSKKGESAQVSYLKALGEFYNGNFNQASDQLSNVSSHTHAFSAWLKNYLTETKPILLEMKDDVSEHFILKANPKEMFLSTYALEALEKAYLEIGKDLNVFPKGKITVEIYDTQSSFSISSTLSKETLDRSGAIGICKFRRLMILSPQQLAFGYRWLDTLAHEFTHYLINLLSAGKCPLWLHEGISKYLETRWRLKEPLYLIPGNRTELARAVKEDTLIPFSRMAPSMVYLKDQTEVRKAFSQVSHAIDFALKKQKISLSKFLVHLSTAGQEEAFYASLGINFEQFERKWKDFLQQEHLKESPGALPDKLSIGKKADEIEEFAGTDIRGHIRLGDRFKQNGQLQVALIQYDKALSKEANNPVALTRSARILLAMAKQDEAIRRLEKCVYENPNYATAYLVLCEEMIRNGNWDRALWSALEANAINPFNPEVHKKLSDIYDELGESKASEKEIKIHRFLLEKKGNP